jgi:type VI secretion system protein ImpC
MTCESSAEEGGIVMQANRTTLRSASRVVFDYPVPNNGRTDFQEIPFIIGILANFSGTRESSSQRRRAVRFVDVLPGSLDPVLESVKPALRLSVANHLSAEPSAPPLNLELKFDALQDFEPQSITARLPAVQDLLRREIDVEARPELEARIGKQLDTILHEPSFERLHAAWLGLERILDRCATVPSARIAILDITKEEITSDSDARTVSEELAGAMQTLSGETYGGHPPAVLLADFQFGPQDVNVLSVLAKKAEASQTVIIGSASPKFLPGDRFFRLNDIDRIHRQHKEMSSLEEWRVFRRQECPRYMFLTLPPILLREPYRDVHLQLAGFEDVRWCSYNEYVNSSDLSGYLWGNGVHAIGCCIAAAFAQYGWVAALSPLDSSGITLDYPIHVDNKALCPITIGPTAVAVWHYTVTVLSAMGFLPLVECKGTPTLAAFDDHSCNKSDDATASLLYSLGLCRLRHSFSLWRRHKNLTELKDVDVEKEIRHWLSRYVRPADAPSDPSGESRWPLEKYDLNITSGSIERTVELEVFLNYGAKRCAVVRFEIPIQSPSAGRKSLRDVSEGSLEANVRVGGKAASTGSGRF